MFESEIKNTYIKIDELFNLKIKAQPKNSGYAFDKLIHIHDLVEDDKYYVTLFNEKPISFRDRADLIAEYVR